MPSGPKSNKFVNRHAAEAMQRDEERKSATKAAVEKAREDALWEETDAKTLKKLERDREAEERAREQERRRTEMQQQLADEDRELDKSKVPTKVSKKALQREMAKLVASYDAEVAKVRGPALDDAPAALLPAGSPKGDVLPVQNPNRSAKGETGVTHVSASGSVGHAVAALEAAGASAQPATVPDDRHVGKRAKALYRHFCEEHVARVKEEHPGMRRSQYNDVLWEMWQKSPMNPFVQRSEARNAERLAEERRWMEEGDDVEDDEEEEAAESGSKKK